MITPAYSITASERALPKLTLDFTTASLDSRVTVSRALNTATRVNSSGYIETVNADLPRFDFSTTSIGACNGLLIEEARINLVPYSEDMSTWDTTAATVLTNQINAPNNTLTADAFIEDTSTTEHYSRTPPISIASGAYISQSIFLKTKGRNAQVRIQGANVFSYIIVEVDLSSGAYSPLGVYLASDASVTVKDYRDGWYRVTLTGVFDASVTSVRTLIYLVSGGIGGAGTTNYKGNGTSGIYYWGDQLEQGAFATSYIPNLSSGTTTRNADVVSMTGTNFSSWYNQPAGTFVLTYIEGQNPIVSGNRMLSDTAQNRIPLYQASTTRLASYDGVNIKTFDSGALVPAGLNKAAVAWDATTMTGCVNAGATSSGTFDGNYDLVGLRIFAAYDNVLVKSGYVQKLAFYPQRLTNAELQAFTK